MNKMHNISVPDHINCVKALSQMSQQQYVFEKQLVDHGSMISIQDNVDVLNTTSPRKLTISKIQIQPTLGDKSMTQLKEFKTKTSSTVNAFVSTNRSRISQLTLNNNAVFVTGEASLSRPQLMFSKGFLTNEELRNGNHSHIKSIDRSLSKLHDISKNNWNILDLNKSNYASPSNFAKSYSKDPKERLQNTLSLNTVLDKMLSKQIRIDPKELRNQQISDISEMIKEQRMRNGTVLSPASPMTNAETFNKKRNETNSLVHALNVGQRSLYMAYRDQSKDQI